MEEENVQVEEEVVLQEDNTTTEETEETEETREETVTLTKAEYKKLQRQSLAYKAKKENGADTPQPKEGHSIDTLFLIKDLAADEYVTLKEEADDLGVPLDRYLTSQSGKSVLGKLRQEKKSKEASVSLNSKSPVFKKFTQEDLSKMTAAELEKILPH